MVIHIRTEYIAYRPESSEQYYVGECPYHGAFVIAGSPHAAAPCSWCLARQDEFYARRHRAQFLQKLLDTLLELRASFSGRDPERQLLFAPEAQLVEQALASLPYL